MTEPARAPRTAADPATDGAARAAVVGSATRAATRPSRARVATAFAAVYLVWGSTYLAIRYAIETLPPFLMAGTRFVTAGALLYLWSRWRGVERPSAVQWRATTLIGGLLLLGGNGGVTWAEQRVPSGLAALLVAVVPLWVVLLDWARGGRRPTPGIVAGVVLGLAGLALLVGIGGGGASRGGARVDGVGALVLVVASLSWAVGSVYSSRAPLPASKVLATGMEMLGGGALLLAAGLATGEVRYVALDAVSARSVLAMLYLIAFGSLVGFTAYIWLLGATAPAKAATYAYVNPVVAVLLGWAVAGEPVTARTLVAGAIIVAAVALITASKSSSATTDDTDDVDGAGGAPRQRARAVRGQPRAGSGTTSATLSTDDARAARARTAPARP